MFPIHHYFMLIHSHQFSFLFFLLYGYEFVEFLPKIFLLFTLDLGWINHRPCNLRKLKRAHESILGVLTLSSCYLFITVH